MKPKPKTLEEYMIVHGTEADHQWIPVITMLCELPHIKDLLKSLPDHEGVRAAFKAGLVFGFHAGGNFVKDGHL